MKLLQWIERKTMAADEGWTFQDDKSPYSREWREWVIEKAELPKLHKYEKVTETEKEVTVKASRKNMVLVLKALDTGYRSVSMRISTIEKKTKLSRSSIKRAIYCLENLRLIDVTRLKRGSGKRASRFIVGYMNLDSIIPDSLRNGEPDRVSPADQPKVHDEPTEGSQRTDRRFTVNPSKVHGEPYNRSFNRTSNQSSKTGSGSVFSNLTKADLTDNQRLLDWFRWVVTQRNSPVRDSEVDLLFVFASAERALEKGSNPVGFFVKLVGRDLRQNINQLQEDRAKKRINKLQGKGTRYFPESNHPDLQTKQQSNPKSIAATLEELHK